ncbi:RluA family pseudouridine synthase [Candidatus Daviesbacteria bacterium]|nr:RluA family pseudouridine synthase [Candidatus Daviesbacteria bacterium]
MSYSEQQVASLRSHFNDLVLYEDSRILVMNKPAGVSVTGDEVNRVGVSEIAKELRGSEIALAHRLDMYTSGVLLLGKTRGARRSLSDQFKERQIGKTYLALVDGEWNPSLAGIVAPIFRSEDEGLMKVGLNNQAKPAATAFEEIAQLGIGEQLRSLLKVDLLTGRTHQIRVHLAYLGYPVTGDQLYNPDKLGFIRPLLHAYEISFRHPHTEEEMILTAPLADDFYSYLANSWVLNHSGFFEEVIANSAN